MMMATGYEVYLRDLLAQGARFVRLKPREKVPDAGEGWSDPCNVERVHAQALQSLNEGYNIGILTGVGGIIDVDIDVRVMEASEATRRGAASWACKYLFTTVGASTSWGRRMGLGDAPTPSHILYRLKDARRGRTLKLNYMELRYKSSGGTYMQSMIPPSVHPDGSTLVWLNPPSTLADVDYPDLERAARIVDAVLVLSEVYKEGKRHNIVGALSGWLLRNGWTKDEVSALVKALCDYTKDGDLSDRLRFGADTAAKLSAGDPVVGLPTIVEMVGDTFARQLSKSLGVSVDTPSRNGQHKTETGGVSTNGLSSTARARVDLLIQRALALIDAIYITHNDRTYVSVQRRGSRYLMDVQSPDFVVWVKHTLRHFGEPAISDDLAKQVGEYLSEGEIDGEHSQKVKRIHDVSLRIGGSVRRGEIYVATHWDGGVVIKITRDGWTVIPAEESPVAFLRDSASIPLPTDLPPHSEQNALQIYRLARYVRGGVDNYIRVLVWLLSQFYTESLSGATDVLGKHARPMLVLTGMQGSGKSSLATRIAALVDASKLSTQTGVDKDADKRTTLGLFSFNRVVIWDNISRITRGLSDILCPILDGSGYTQHRLYTQGDGSKQRATYGTRENSVIITTIADAIKASDLADRSILVALPALTGHEHGDVLDEQYRSEYPILLSALFSLVSLCLRGSGIRESYGSVRYARYVEFAASGLHRIGIHHRLVSKIVQDAYNEAILSAGSGDLIPALAEILRGLCEGATGAVQKTATELFETITQQIGDDEELKEALPKTERWLGRLLMNKKTQATLLKVYGLKIDRKRTNRSYYTIERVDTVENDGLFAETAERERNEYTQLRELAIQMVRTTLQRYPTLTSRSEQSETEPVENYIYRMVSLLTEPDDTPPDDNGGIAFVVEESMNATDTEPETVDRLEEETEYTPHDTTDGDSTDSLDDPTAGCVSMSCQGNPLLEEWERLPIPAEKRDGMRRIAELAHRLGYPEIHYSSIKIENGRDGWLYCYRSIPIHQGAVQGILNILGSLDSGDTTECVGATAEVQPTLFGYGRTVPADNTEGGHQR